MELWVGVRQHNLSFPDNSKKFYYLLFWLVNPNLNEQRDQKNDSYLIKQGQK